MARWTTGQVKRFTLSMSTRIPVIRELFIEKMSAFSVVQKGNATILPYGVHKSRPLPGSYLKGKKNAWAVMY